ncbi:unnamed protein product, partial [Rotaria sp. Silwood2]
MIRLRRATEEHEL